MDANTQLAIETYRKLLAAEAKAERLRWELGQYARSIPPEEMEEYVRITYEMEDAMPSPGLRA